MRKFSKKMMTVVLSIIMLIAVSMLAGCGVEVTARGNAFYPNENHGNVAASRNVTQHRNESPSNMKWTFGNPD